MQGVVSPSALPKIRLQPDLVCLIPDDLPFPAVGHTIESINEQIPVAVVIHAECPAPELPEPVMECGMEVRARKQSLRILTELREYRLPDKCTARALIKVVALRIELATIVGHQCNADQVAVYEVRKFGIDKNPHRRDVLLNGEPRFISRPAGQD
ncbi:hypothetical protein [Paraburkholderia megapolitana]|uniref:hypothetical protein n=1 Tax=Paraburkholderia megapolitana TaxID=420953 RepID=UPI003898EF43